MTLQIAASNDSPAERASGQGAAVSPSLSRQQRIPVAFQLLLGLYIVLTGTLPTIIQALAFGIEPGAGSEFTAAMVTGLAFDACLLVPIIVLSNHPLGILHPLLLAVIVWPLMIHIPNVLQDWGGWSGVLAGARVDAPNFIGLPNRSPSFIWGGITKYNIIRVLAVGSTYLGFWLYSGRPPAPKGSNPANHSAAVKTILIGMIAFSMLALAVFVYFRGGLNEHLTSLGRGRFKELSGDGVMMVMIDLGTIALMIWAAARPREIKSPLFLMCTVAVAAAAFISNGSRGGALEVPLLVGLIWAMRRRTIPWKVAVALIPLMFLAIGFLGAIRTSSWQGATAGEVVQNSTWSQAFERAQLEITMRNAASANVPVLQRGFQVSGGPLLGLSYAPAITSFVPRPLWPTKPRGVGSLYSQLFFQAAIGATSIPVSPEVEMYWNFSFPGVVILSLLYGIAIRAAYYFLSRRYPDPFIITSYVLFITSFQFSSDRIVGLEQRTFLVIFCYLAITLLLPKEQSFVPRRPLQQIRA